MTAGVNVIIFCNKSVFVRGQVTLMLAGKSGAYQVKHLPYRILDLTRKHSTKLEKLAWDKHSSFLWKLRT